LKFKKNDTCKISIVDIGKDGEGIGKIDGFTFFVPNALPEEVVSIKILKLKKNYGYGKVLEVVKPSPMRALPLCDVFYKCGGCNIMHMDYKSQLFYKEKKTKDSLERIGGFSDVSEKIMPIIGMKEPFFYRNKVSIPIREENGRIKAGFFALNSHRIVEADECKIQPKISKNIVDVIIAYMRENNIKAYNEEKNSGVVRHVLIKYGFKTGEIMVCIVVNLTDGKKFENEEGLVSELLKIDGIKSISLNYNSQKTNVILGKFIRNVYGVAYIKDYIGDILFNISPLSFYQVNPVQTKALYDTVLDFCEFKGDETVVDAYCGIGSISLYIAKHVKKVIGIEIVEDAVKDAKINAKNNNISNAEFLLGAAEEIMQKFVEKPDIIIVDPPRKGCDIRLLESILESGVKKMVYVSCNPDTLARDLKILCENKYKIAKIQPVDMFPHSFHVENVVLLER